MKHILVTLLFFSSVAFSFAQGKASLGIELGFPVGSNTDGVKTGFGASFRYEKPLNKNFSWLASLGYLYFPASKTETFPGSPPQTVAVDGHFTFVPILGGIKYYVKESFNGFYIGTDLGMTAMSFSGSVSVFGSSFPISQDENKFTVAPNIGIHGKKLDFGIRYSMSNDTNYIGTRIAMVFN